MRSSPRPRRAASRWSPPAAADWLDGRNGSSFGRSPGAGTAQLHRCAGRQRAAGDGADRLGGRRADLHHAGLARSLPPPRRSRATNMHSSPATRAAIRPSTATSPDRRQRPKDRGRGLRGDRDRRPRQQHRPRRRPEDDQLGHPARPRHGHGGRRWLQSLLCPQPRLLQHAAPTDDFTYTLNGGSTATVAVTVNCVDDPPHAVNDQKTVAEDSGTTTIDVRANDTDPDGGPKTISSATQPAHGTVTVAADGSNLSYGPTPTTATAPPPPMTSPTR